MNKVISQIGDMLDRRRIPFQTRQDDENVLRFRLTLPESRADVIFFISYYESENNFNLAVSRIARFKERIIDIYKLMNRFNSDPQTYNCKMFLDDEGYVIVTCNAVIASGELIKQVEEYIGIALEALDKYYPQIVDVIKKGNAEIAAAREASQES